MPDSPMSLDACLRKELPLSPTFGSGKERRTPTRPGGRGLLLGIPVSCLALAVFLSGCGSDEIPDSPLGTPPPPLSRPSDGLLENPRLQEVVDLQVDRDGPALRTLLASNDPAVRARAAFALASVQDPDAGRDLAGLLTDPEAGVRRDAAFALGQLSDPLFGPVLLGALRDESAFQVRYRLLEAIGKVGDEGVLEALLDLELPLEEEGARNLAVARLGIRGVTLPTGIRHLADALTHPDQAARTNAAYYFGRNPSAGPWTDRAAQLRSALDSLPPSDPPAMYLLSALALVGDAQDSPRFLWWMKNSPDWRIRANAANAVGGRTTETPARQGLLDALDDPSTHVAFNAAEALLRAQQLGPGERDRMKEWVEDHPDEWRRAGPILAILGRMGEGEFLTTWLSRWPEEEVIPRTRGLGAVAFVSGEEADQTLLEASRSAEPRIRATALGGMARRWRADRQDPSKLGTYYEAFAAGLKTGDPAAVFVTASVLADSAFFPMGSLNLLMDEYRASSLPEDLEGMQAILRALGQTGAPEAEALLEEALEASHRAIRATAAQVLGRLRGDEASLSPEPEESDRSVDWSALAELGPRPRLILETEKGSVTLVLDAESAPLTVQTIAGFAREGRFDGTPFHRVIPNFVAQGGDFSRADGFGDPGFTIKSEFTEISYQRGIVGMASAGKDTEGSQFFLTHSMQPHLDGGYTAFGWVVEGMDVVDRLYEEDRVLGARVEPDRS
jgi:cyclophilin family peptidyl-prolyl cis-trans isomerase